MSQALLSTRPNFRLQGTNKSVSRPLLTLILLNLNVCISMMSVRCCSGYVLFFLTIRRYPQFQEDYLEYVRSMLLTELGFTGTANQEDTWCVCTLNFCGVIVRCSHCQCF